MTDDAGEQFCNVGGLSICFRSYGPDGAPAVLLLAGLSMQLIAWPPALVEGLVRSGCRVLVYDHRDCGRSSHLRDAGLPDLLAALRRDTSRLAYGLEDLARDALGLLSALSIRRCHLFGVSMGAMVAQQCAIIAPERAASLCSVMGSPSDGRSGGATNEALALLVSSSGRSPEEAVDQAVRRREVLGSPAFGFDEEAERALADAAYARGHDAAGSARQLAAVLAAADRTEALHRLSVPTLVIHGAADLLVDPSGGEATAKAVPNARYLRIEGMGHDLPPGCIETILEAELANITAGAGPGPT